MTEDNRFSQCCWPLYGMAHESSRKSFGSQCRASRPGVRNPLPACAKSRSPSSIKRGRSLRNAMSSGYCALIASASSTGLTGVPCGRPGKSLIVVIPIVSEVVWKRPSGSSINARNITSWFPSNTMRFLFRIFHPCEDTAFWSLVHVNQVSHEDKLLSFFVPVFEAFLPSSVFFAVNITNNKNMFFFIFTCTSGTLLLSIIANFRVNMKVDLTHEKLCAKYYFRNRLLVIQLIYFPSLRWIITLPLQTQVTPPMIGTGILLLYPYFYNSGRFGSSVVWNCWSFPLFEPSVVVPSVVVEAVVGC